MDMKIELFERLLLRHGTDIERWPRWRRAAARRLLSKSEEARCLLQRLSREDHLLRRALAPPALPTELREQLERITAQFPQHRRQTNDAAQTRHLFRVGVAWALACGLTGVLVGATGLVSTGTDDYALVALAFGSQNDTDMDLGELP